MNNTNADFNVICEKLSIESVWGGRMDFIPGGMYLWRGRSVQYLGYLLWGQKPIAWVKLMDDLGYGIATARDLRMPLSS